MNDREGSPSSQGREAKRIEWTGAGGDYFLGIAVDQKDEVIAEFWGTRKEILSWMETSWPQLPKKYVPMVYTPGHRIAPNGQPPPRKKKHQVA
jgi:hypothetical protein